MQSRKLALVLAVLAAFMVVDSALAYYNPSTGRFLNRDPIGEPGSILIRQVAARGFIARDPIDDQSNMYRYVRNAPTVRIDPFGLTSDYVWTKCKKDCATTHGLNPDDWKGQQEAYDKGGGFRSCVDGCVKKYPDPEGQCDDGDMGVECWVDYSGLSIACHLGDDWVSCPIVCPSQKDFKKELGPTPPGTYKIDKRRIHPRHQCGWYNLCAYSGSGCKFGGYNEGHPKYPGRDSMGLHPGTVSQGCVTVTKDCWDKLDALVQRGKAKESGGHGRLVVTNAVPQ
jgi:hypothetical protein